MKESQPVAVITYDLWSFESDIDVVISSYCSYLTALVNEETSGLFLFFPGIRKVWAILRRVFSALLIKTTLGFFLKSVDFSDGDFITKEPLSSFITSTLKGDDYEQTGVSSSRL